MSALAPAHRGYAYQDLLVACRLVDVLLDSVEAVHVDEKLTSPHDLFDDLTTIDNSGRRERVQIKHTGQADRALELSTFTTKSGGLRLDQVVATALADRDGPGRGANTLLFRLVLRDTLPTDKQLIEALAPADPDPGPFVPTMASSRLTFRFAALAGEADVPVTSQTDYRDPFSILARGDPPAGRDDLNWVCNHLVLELNAPPASFSLIAPGPAEDLLLRRVRHEIGAGVHPNALRSPVDVAAALIDCAQHARNGVLIPTKKELLKHTRLRTNFGAVARRSPVDKNVEIERSDAVSEILAQVAAAAAEGTALLVVGPPGQGKSWICDQITHRLSASGWIVAEHYCYLGDADADRLPRVLPHSVCGSLLERLSARDSGITDQQRPRFAATKEALSRAVHEATLRNPGNRVALVVDGLDHVTRVVDTRTVDPSFELAEQLASLDLPIGSVLIVLSQPGVHLEPLEDVSGAVRVKVPDMSDEELRQLAVRLNVAQDLPNEHRRPASSAPLSDGERIDEFVKALSYRSAGNPLYATYLCREALRTTKTAADPAGTVNSLPQFDGCLSSYYEHVQESLGAEGLWVADALALLDFPVTRTEMKEIQPTYAHRVDRAIEVLRPVLREPTQLGLRIYHESFARFLGLQFRPDESARTALLDVIIEWLESKGLFDDPRTHQHLLRLLHQRGQDDKIVRLVDRDFVANSISHGFPASATTTNLSIALRSAARVGDWPSVVRHVEMSRSVETFQEERFESTIVGFVDVVSSLLSADALAERLLYDGRPIMAARAGLQMCAALDAMGAVAPWPEYLAAFGRERREDPVSYGQASDQAVALACLRGRLRVAPLGRDRSTGSDPLAHAASRESDAEVLHEPVSLAEVAATLDAGHLPTTAVVDAVLDTRGHQTALELIAKVARPGACYLALAEAIAERRSDGPDGDARHWAKQAVESGLPVGSAWRVVALGLEAPSEKGASTEEARQRLLDLTRQVQDPILGHEPSYVEEWLDSCLLAASRDRIGLDASEALLKGPSWYVCWLRFAMSLARAETKPKNAQSKESLEALRHLTDVDARFLGEPHVGHLYSLYGLIEQTIRRAIQLLDDADWADALQLLERVSQTTSITIRGEQSGPLSHDRLLHVAVDSATPSRYRSSQALVDDALETGGDRRYYTDLAEYRLIAARLALKLDDSAKARRHWIDACRLLTAYGWRKDRTLFELLDPLPALISIDPARGRSALAKLQPLCERVWKHTDGKETRHAPSQWWRLLASADPCALSRIVQRTLLSSCNDPDPLLHGARFALWRAWHHRAHPLLAGALRLTLEEPLDECDPDALKLLCGAADLLDDAGYSQLLSALLARADERPFEYGVTDDEHLIARDNEHVRALNTTAVSASAPTVAALPTLSAGSGDGVPRVRRSAARSHGSRIFQGRSVFPGGAAGLVEAVRAWQDRYQHETPSDSVVQRFTNVLGYRLLELPDSDGEIDAEETLRLIADATGFEDRSGLLKALSEGLERHGHMTLAAVAATLAWTRRRGGGGWLTFGGSTEIESLRRASELDATAARRTLARDVARVVLQGLGTLGVTQALVYAFASTSLSESTSTPFAIWDEAFAVIAQRMPRVAASDDPDYVYSVPDSDAGTEILGDIDTGFTFATVAGLAHGGREQKRRTLLAIRLLINHQASTAASALASALTTISDPATLTWLLRTIELTGERGTAIVSVARPSLRRLAEAPHLTVRALARRLLADDEIPMVPPADPDPELVMAGTNGLFLPSSIDLKPQENTTVDDVVDLVAGARLARSEHLCPGLRQAVRRRVAATRTTEEHKRRLRAQVRAYADEARKLSPDAFSATHEAVEDAIQRASTGLRGARIMNGETVTDPETLEELLAQSLLDDPTLPLVLERTRQPRPDVPPPPPRGHPLWRTVDPTQHDDDDVPSGTLEVCPYSEVPRLEGGRYRGWRLVATIERRSIPRSNGYDKEYDWAERYRVIELRPSGDSTGLTSPPISRTLLWKWNSSPTSSSSASQATSCQPLVCSDRDVGIGDAAEGLGIQENIVTPNPWLLNVLNAKGSADFVVDDHNGPVVGLITWRTEYETSDYYLPWPRLCGSGLAVRGDAFDLLIRASQGALVLRDFLVGSPSLGD